MFARLFILLTLCAATAQAQLTTDQRLADFRNLWDLYARRYSAIEWKRTAVKFDILDLNAWASRVNSAKSDLDFYDVMIDFVSNLQDAHDQFLVPSNFEAQLGFKVDIYDGKILIDQIDRKLLPAARYPFAIGDELVSVDGRTSEDWIALLSKYVSGGNPRTVRRLAAELITDRIQAEYPHAASTITDAAQIVVRRQSGASETYPILWQKTGLPLNTLGPSAGQTGASRIPKASPMAAHVPLYKQFLIDRHNYLRPGRINVLGFDELTPVFTLPSGFVQRQGKKSYDSYYSGTYTTPEGVRIGFLRIPDFGYADTDTLDTEIPFMDQNTDVLVVDIMRNPGGDACAAEDTISYLNPNPFEGLVAEFRVDWSDIVSVDSAQTDAQIFGFEDDYLYQLNLYKREFVKAFATPGGRTGALPICSWDTTRKPAKKTYSKPVLVLTDEMSASAADIFAALMQDNMAATLFGYRTMGAGGSPEETYAGVYTEGSTSVTRTLAVRPRQLAYDGYPASVYIENVGVHPNIEADYMTASNLLNKGADFVAAFTAAAAKLAAKSGN